MPQNVLIELGLLTPSSSCLLHSAHNGGIRDHYFLRSIYIRPELEFLAEANIFLSTTASVQTGSGGYPAFLLTDSGRTFHWNKEAGYGVDYSSPSSGEFNENVYVVLLHISSCRGSCF